MPNATATQVKKSNNPFDIFITGLRKGFNVAINNLMPNVLMAFVLAYILDLFGVMSFLGKVCGPVMSPAKLLPFFAQLGCPAAQASVLQPACLPAAHSMHMTSQSSLRHSS